MKPIDSGYTRRSHIDSAIPAYTDGQSYSQHRGLQSRKSRWLYGCAALGLMLYGILILREPMSGYFGRSDLLDENPNKGHHALSREDWTDWLDIEPSERLNWQPCFGVYDMNLHCTRLTVPMDYDRPLSSSANNPKVHLALILVPGVNRDFDDPPSFASSPVLTNPGGPGGSGTTFTGLYAQHLQPTLGDQNDIIGFDPRGVGFTTPVADCFASPGSNGRHVSLVNRMSWTVIGQSIGLVNSSDVALGKLEFRERAMNKLCKRIDENEGDASIFKHMSTPYVARDMITIVDAWDEWRTGGKTTQSQEELDPDRQKDATEKEESLAGKLVYWGFSYGSYLGATFASLFPDRVGRMILDGIVQADHYVSPMWTENLIDADAIFNTFFEYCARLGSLCSFYNPGDEPGDIMKRFERLMSQLEEEPFLQLSPDSNVINTISVSDVKKVIFYGLYSPLMYFPVVAPILRGLESGKLFGWVTTPRLDALCSSLPLLLWPDDAQRVIACTDRSDLFKGNIADLKNHFNRLASTSWFGDVWFGIAPNLGCSSWEIESKKPPLRWGNQSAHDLEPIKTNYPILFLSQSLDPVTPLSYALNMTKTFANASIIETDGAGHCSFACVSTCTLKHMRAYINDGVVPPPPRFHAETDSEGEWTKCACDGQYWTNLSLESEETSTVADGEISAEAVQAYRKLSAAFASFTFDQQLDHHNPLKEEVVRLTSLLREETT
ncbi:alpha/beta-hydrolase [Xylariaceae sp. FL0255]|nr:alpha/beta-hydrolase [Xylariaceae sp. FL0255]